MVFFPQGNGYAVGAFGWFARFWMLQVFFIGYAIAFLRLFGFDTRRDASFDEPLLLWVKANGCVTFAGETSPTNLQRVHVCRGSGLGDTTTARFMRPPLSPHPLPIYWKPLTCRRQYRREHRGDLGGPLHVRSRQLLRSLRVRARHHRRVRGIPGGVLDDVSRQGDWISKVVAGW